MLAVRLSRRLVLMSKMLLDINEPEQIKVLSAHLQDSIIRISDIAFLAQQRRFALVANRFCWENSENKNQRILCGFHFDDVEKVRYRGFSQENREKFIHLLAICFEPDDRLAGRMRLIFAGQHEIELQVEGVQVLLHDIGEAWDTKARPQHTKSKSKSTEDK